MAPRWNGPPDAVVTGTATSPRLELRFTYSARHATTGGPLREWVKELPDRAWDGDAGCWVVTGIGDDPAAILGDAGFDDYALELTVDPADWDTDPISSIDDLVTPVVTTARAAGMAAVHPRLGGRDLVKPLLPSSATWADHHNCYLVPVTAFPISGLVVAETVAAAIAAEAFEVAAADRESGAVASVVAASTGLDESAADVDELAEIVGDIPDWFGLSLDPYQRAGALAAFSGHRVLADEPGLGKTRQALAVAALARSKRTVIVAPPVVLTAWEREATASNLATLGPDPNATPPGSSASNRLLPPKADQHADPGVLTSLVDQGAARTATPADAPGEVVVIRAGRKQKPLPQSGVVVVADSLLVSRPSLLDDLVAWWPEVVIVDEAHRTKTFFAKRSKACRALAQAASKIPLAVTGTPLFADPLEMAGCLEIAGHLGPTFGGFDAYRERYCMEDFFHRWHPRKDRLPELLKILNDKVWVQRSKIEVATDLPPKRRLDPTWVDCDATEFRRAHAEVSEVIDTWLDRYFDANDRMPTEREIRSWAGSNVSLITRLRLATGVVKIPAAIEEITTWVDRVAGTAPDGGFDRPLVVWVHHSEVGDAILDAVPGAGAILGRTSSKERDRMVDEYQSGKIAVLVCSIHAAGVGITLTRGCDSLFVEGDWTPVILSQAEDRQARRGQTRPVTVRTMIAPGTLDEKIQSVLLAKTEILDEVLVLADDDVAVLDFSADDAVTAVDIITELAQDRVARRPPARRQAA